MAFPVVAMDVTLFVFSRPLLCSNEGCTSVDFFVEIDRSFFVFVGVILTLGSFMSPPADFFFFLVLRSVVRAAASASQQSFSGNTSSHKFSFSSSSSNNSGFVSSLPCVNPAPAKK